MKIVSFEVMTDFGQIAYIEVQTDLGRRLVKLAAPIDVEPTDDMPPQFRSLTELLWGVLREAAIRPLAPTTLNAEA